MTAMTHEEALAHFGVKGMHWGQRKAESSTGSGGSSGKAKTPKPTRNDILTARAMQRHLADKSWDIHDKMVSATTDKGRLAAAKELQKNTEAFDKAGKTAQISTGREKVGAVLAWSALAVVVTARIALAAGGSKRL